MHRTALFISTCFFLSMTALRANTSIIVTSGASADGSVMVSYSRDSNNLGGFMDFSPRKYNDAGTMEILSSPWEGKTLRTEVDVSGDNYRFSGHMNEHQLVIGDSSFIPLFEESVNFYKSRIDTGMLIEMTLRKAATARQAISYMDSLLGDYGFYGSGKSFSIADKSEAWIMELISKGPRGEGVLWVARRIPEGYVSGHADSARITTFPLGDEENCLYSDDVISFARENGLWDGSDEDFSFADVYTVMNPMDIRRTEGRLWNIFRKVNRDAYNWKEYITGDIKRRFPVTGTANGIISNRLPLWVKADAPLTASDVKDLMRDHYENTDLDMGKGIWSGPFGNPYRLRPDNGVAREYFYNHDRPVSVQYTGYSFVSQSRRNVPDEIGGISWFGVDDTYMTVYLPVYSGARSVPSCLSKENNPVASYSDDSAYWLFNLLSNFAIIRFEDMIIDIEKVQQELEEMFTERLSLIEEEALKMPRKEAGHFLAEQSEEMGRMMMDRWRELFHYLIIKYKDGEVRAEKNGVFQTEPFGFTEALQIYGYPADWAQAMIGKDNPPDLKALYSDDELMELFAKNNRRSLLVVSLLGLTAILIMIIIILSVRVARKP